MSTDSFECLKSLSQVRRLVAVLFAQDYSHWVIPPGSSKPIAEAHGACASPWKRNDEVMKAKSARRMRTHVVMQRT